MMIWSPLLCAVLLLLVAVPPYGVHLNGGLQAPAPRASWEQIIQDSTNDYDFRLGAVAADGRIWVIAGERPKGQMRPPQRLDLWRLSVRGEVGPRIDLDQVMTDGQTGATSIAILALAVLRDRVAFGVQTPTGGTSFLIADSANVRAVGRTKIQSPASLVVSRMAPCPDGGLLALGTAGGRAWIAKLDPSGSVSWQRTLTDTEATAIADGVQLLDGTIVLLGAAAPTGSGSASAPTWVGRLSGKGDLLAQANLQMTGVGIAAFRDGRVAVLEEKSASIGKDISVRFLDAGLSERQNLALASGVKGAFPFRMASFGDDAIVLGYTKEFVPWAAQVTADAQLGWTETRPYDAKQVPVVGRLDVLADTTGAVALFTLAVVDDKGEQRQTVRVVKYDAVTKR